jgi:hypothetical protein
MRPYIDSLEGETLLDLVWDKQKTVCEEQFTIEDIFLKLYERFSFPDGKELCGHVGTVKVLHLFNPDLFPMWDNGMINKGLKSEIRKRGISLSKHGYIKWVNWMIEEAREIVSSTKRRDPLRFLQNEYLKLNGYQAKIIKSLPKMLDEYYYARYSREWYKPCM